MLGHKVAEHILEGGAPRALNVPAGSYQTTDGWMMVTLVNEPQYKRLCAAIGRDDLASDPRFADFARRADAVDALIPQLREVFLTQPTEAWLARLHAADLIAERILNPGEWLRNVHVEATRAAVCQQTPGVGPVYSPRTPGIASFSEDDLRPAPDIGQDSYEVLLEAGFERGAIDDLVRAGAVRQARNQGRRGMSTDLVRYSVSDNIAEIMLDRPPVNALSMDLIDALLAALAKARDDEAVRAVIIGSAHKVFCAGLDLDIVRGKPGIETKKFLERLYFALNDTQYRMGKPTIAAVDGAVRAGGMTIAISCDMIIAGDACTFGYPEIDVGLIPAIHFVQLPRLVGKHQAFGPLFLGEPFRCRDRLSHGAAQRGRAEGNRARAGARDCAEARRQIAHRHEDRPRRLHARGRCRFPPLGRKRGREFCAGRNDGRLSGRLECVRREADAKLQGTLMAGLYFEEFEVGREFHHEFSRTVTEMDNTMFSLLTMNPQPLHIDAHFSEKTEFGQRLFNSLYTLGIMIGMSVYDTTLGTTIGNLGMTDVKFPKPVFHGDTLKAHTKIISKRASKSRPTQGIVEFEHTMTNQRGEVVASCRRTGLMHCKPKA